MAVTQYIGSRYVPLFADPAEWSSTKTYEPLTIVLHQGNSYTSKQFVPVGIDIANTDFWAETGNYNAQVEQYRREVHTLSDKVARQPFIFDNVDEMKQSALIAPGDFCLTAGYTTSGDGGAALYEITDDAALYDDGAYIQIGNYTAKCVSYRIPYATHIKENNEAYIYANVTELSTLLDTLLNDFDVIYVPEGTYTISRTVDVPANKSIVFAGTYKDASIAKSEITTFDNVVMFKLHDQSKVQGGYINLQDTKNTIAFKIDCSNEGVSNVAIVDGTIIGGRETYRNLTQTGVFVECDNVNITEHGHLVYANFDLDIETVFCAYHMHRNHAAATSSGVWLTNNYYNGYMRHCTRYIWNDFTVRGYSNNQCVYNAVIQGGSLITDEPDYPGINVVGDNSRFNGQMWDFGGTHQSTGIKFELGATQNIVFVNTVIDPDGANLNATYSKIIKSLYSGTREITYGEKITDGSMHAYRIGQFLVIWGTFKAPQGLLSGDVICTFTNTRAQAVMYMQLYRSGAPVGTANINSVANSAISASTEIPASGTWTYISAVIPLYNVPEFA